jgi:hypothetical protein
MIYPEFDRSKHVIPERRIPEDAYVYCGIDPGMRVMAAVIWVYVETDGRIVVFDELGVQGETVEAVAKRMHLINTKHGVKPDPESNGQPLPIKPRAYVIDPSARNVEHISGRSIQREFVDHGIYTVLAQNSVPAGINRVKERLENGKLLIMGNCHQLIDEFRKYRWATPGRTENDPKEKPVKHDDHLLDALRYVVMHRPYGPELVEQSDESQLERLLKEDRMELNKKTLGRVEGIPV